MRKKLTIATLAILAMAFVGIAFGKQIQGATIKFTKTKAGSSTGIDSTFKVSDPANKKPGIVGKPTKQIVRVDIQFPKGTKFNYKTLPQCSFPAGAKYNYVDQHCKKSLLGVGTTTIDAREPNGKGLGLLNGKLYAYNAVNSLFITTEFKNTALNQILHPTLTGTKLITQLPSALKQIDAYLTDFHLLIKPRSKGSCTFATLPSKCTKAGFKTTVKYYFDGGGTFTTKPVKNKCTK